MGSRIKMALFVRKTSEMAFNTSKCVKTSLRTIIISKNSSLNSVKLCNFKSNDIQCNTRLQNGLCRTFSTSENLRNDMYFTKKHEWVTVVGNMGTVGITDYAQQSLGDVVYAQLPEVDSEVEVGEECGALESVKAASELYSPVSGKVIEKNVAVEDLPSLINTSAENDGWLFKVELTKQEELKELFDKSSYEEYLKTQEDEH